ncbi:MAG: 3-methyl-2-oxobutanoate hydroxymethyltransferase [Gemmatimonadetes bacterium]|nr:3-methyl-2-oxobutanoate hydroxymethyltransferase [Gemmatimonadota bacterium]
MTTSGTAVGNGTRRKVTLGTLRSMKAQQVPASFVTAYDYPSAAFAEAANIDMILVGDSGGMTMLGYHNTMPVTMEEMMFFSKAVCRGAKKAFVIGDMPFLSYQLSNKLAMQNAGRFISEAGCDAVKLEGGKRMAKRIRAIADSGVAVMGHLGLTPQSISLAGGYKVYGKTKKEFESLREDAIAVEDAGASFILLEAIPEEPAGYIRESVSIPVYGIGAGKKLDGQLLILHDLIGAFVGDIKPKFAKRYANIGEQITKALLAYGDEVKSGQFPNLEHTYPIEQHELGAIRELVQGA